MKNTSKPLRVLSISSYASDLAETKGGVFSGAQQRQLDYADFMDLYIIIVPGREKREMVKLTDKLFIYTVKAGNLIEFAFKSFFLANKLIKKYNITVISADNPFTTGPVASLLKKFNNKPTIINSMADMIDNPHYINERKANYFKNIIAKIAVKNADVIRVSTEAEIADMKVRGYEKTFNAPFYIDFEPFIKSGDGSELRKELLKEKFENIVLFIGRFAAQKDLTAYMRAIKEVAKDHPKALFVLAGYGPLYEEINKMAEDMGISENVLFAGKVPYEKIPSYYKAADIFCATSIYEGTCMTLHEAAICGLPIAATKFSGARDLIKDGENGYLAEIGDHVGVAEGIKKLLSEPELRIIMGRRNKERVISDFGREKALEKHREMYKKIL